MRAVVLVAVLAAAALARVDQSLVDTVRRQTKLWKPTLDSPVARLSESVAAQLFGLDIQHDAALASASFPERKFTAAELARAPASFDSRLQWPNCPSMKMIRDQSNCGSCWAFGSVSAMSDRECVYNKRTVILSSEHMNSCSGCGGCNGGYPFCAYSWWHSHGIATENCQPYSFKSCDHHIPESKNPCPSNGTFPTPKCQKVCKDGKPLDTLYKANRTWTVRGEQAIMAELAENGPMEATFTVYEDFLAYKNGIYHHVTGKSLGGHAVKFVGYGEEDGVKYWIMANSWNPNWGEKGFFRIRRGNSECGIEGTAYAGQPMAA